MYQIKVTDLCILFSSILWTAGEVKIETQSSLIPSPRAKSEKVLGITVATSLVAGKVVGTVVSPSVTSSLELKDSPKEHAVNSPAGGQQPSAMMPNDSWLHVRPSFLFSLIRLRLTLLSLSR